MISDEKFNEAKSDLYQDFTITFLHETTQDKISGILSNGLNLDKSYNGEIARVVNIAKTDDEIKNYNYYTFRDKKSIVVISVPNSIFGDIPPQSFEGILFLNCLSKREEPKVPEGNWIQYKPVLNQRLPSNIPSKWINGVFDEDCNFIKNPNYILRQPNSKELIALSRLEILEEFKKRYPDKYSSLNSSKAETLDDRSL